MSKKVKRPPQVEGNAPTSNLSRAIGQRIVQFRKENRMTQTEVAEEAGIEQSTLSKIETGQSVPDVRTLLRLCTVLDVSEPKMFHGLKGKLIEPRPETPPPAEAPVKGLENQSIDGLEADLV